MPWSETNVDMGVEAHNGTLQINQRPFKAWGRAVAWRLAASPVLEGRRAQQTTSGVLT